MRILLTDFGMAAMDYERKVRADHDATLLENAEANPNSNPITEENKPYHKKLNKLKNSNRPMSNILRNIPTCPDDDPGFMYDAMNTLATSSDIENTLTSNETRINKNKKKRTKEIDINTNKIKINQQIARQYNKESLEKKNNSNLILPQISFKKGESNISDQISGKFYSLKEIISKTEYDKLKRDLIKSHFEHERRSCDNPNIFNFRTDLQADRFLDKFNSLMNTQIKSNKPNLINYLSKKKDISMELVTKLADIDENKTSKLNKACQIHTDASRQEIKKKRDIPAMVKKNHDKLLETSEMDLGIVDKTLKHINDKLLVYDNSLKKNVNVIKEHHNNLQNKYWERLNVNRAFDPSHNKPFVKTNSKPVVILEQPSELELGGESQVFSSRL